MRSSCSECLVSAYSPYRHDAQSVSDGDSEICTWCETSRTCSPVGVDPAATVTGCPRNLVLNSKGCACAQKSDRCQLSVSSSGVSDDDADGCAFVPLVAVDSVTPQRHTMLRFDDLTSTKSASV